MIKQTTSLRKIASLTNKIKAVRGGQGSGKTISILILLINHASSNPHKEILILSSELTKMRKTVIKDFVKVMRLFGIYEDSSFLAGTFYRFPNGSFIQFIGLDKSDVGKGLRADVAYFNEVNKIDSESYRQVASRVRNAIYLDYNPDCEFFVDTDILPREDCDFLQLTFEDNEQLPQSERDEILNYYKLGYDSEGNVINSYWANLWQVYGLGNIGSLQGVVFSNYTIIKELPQQAKLIAYGMDFGYTNDPSTLVGVYTFNNEYYYKEELYSTGLTNQDLADLILPIVKGSIVYADSSEPKSIEELRRKGVNCVGAEKGADSIMYGINLMQQGQFYITECSKNLANELRNYTWLIDKNGNKVNKPIDNHNHLIDPVRYVRTTENKYNGVYR